MKILGIIGGIGPESTIDYYRRLIELHREQFPKGPAPAIVINSVDMTRMVALISSSSWRELVELIQAELKRLADAGADFGLLAANTPHIVFDDLAPRSPIPLISIVEATCEHAHHMGLSRVGLLGTRFTMQAQFYPNVFSRRGISISVPNREDQDYVHDKYFNELVPGVFLDETRAGFIEIIARMKERDEIEAVILGGTELPLILREPAAAGLPLLDTTHIHVRAALDYMLNP